MAYRDIATGIDLTGQVALVTGGGRGLGQAAALGLARAGARVAVLARSAEQVRETAAAIEAAGGRAVAVTADVTKPADVATAAAEAERALGPITYLVNNAGSSWARGATWQVDPDDWWKDMEINVRGPFLVTRAVLPGMLARRQGRIIVISSGAAFVAYPGMAAYPASKAAANRFVETIASEIKEYGLSAFAMRPGTFATALMRHGMEWAERVLKGEQPAPPCRGCEDTARALVRMHEQSPADGLDHAVQMLVFLASGRADGLTGRYIDYEDDLPDLAARADEIVKKDLYAMRLRKP